VTRTPVLVVALAVAALGAVGVLVYALSHAARNRTPVKVPTGSLVVGKASGKSPSGRLPAGLEIAGPQISRTDEQGRLLWSAKAPGSFRYDARTHQVTGTDIAWELTRGGAKASLTAKRMEVGVETGAVRFGDGIALSAGVHRRFSLGSARLEAGTWKVIGEGGVHWVWGRFAVSADQLVVDPVNRKIRLRGGVHLAQR
jgi:hypothetical protein